MSSRVRDAFWRLKNYFGILILFLIGVLFFGGVLFTVQDNSDFLGATDFTLAATSSDATAILEVGDISPQLNVVLNGNSAITLIPNATTAVSVSARIIDQNGCSDITSGGSSTILVYRSGITSSTCMTTQNNLNCYLATTFTASSTCSTYFVDTTTTVGIYYFAQPTDASNSLYSAEDWRATVIFRNSQNTTTSADSAGVELNSMTALELSTSSIDYGTLNSSSTTGFVNKVEGVLNAGNTSSTIKVHGTALVKGSDRIATSSQHYASSSFYYGGSEQELQQTATTISGITLLPRVSLINDLGSWSETTALPSILNTHGATVYNNYVYLLGGNSGTNTSTVFYGGLNTDGTISSWSTTQSLSDPLSSLSAVAYSGYIYRIGGNSTSSVSYSAISSNGTLGVWQTASALPDFILSTSAIVKDGYIYVAGGSNGTVSTSSVYYAAINSDGSLGVWTKTTSLSSALSIHLLVENRGYLYVIGGSDGSSPTTTVAYAYINSSGTVGSWSNTTALPNVLQDVRGVVSDNYIYLVGGRDSGATPTTTVLYASINSNGTVGSWSTGTVLTAATRRQGVVFNNGYVYSIGGFSPSVSATSTVRFIPINNRKSAQDTFWGLKLGNEPPGSYSGVTTFTAVYEP